MPPFAAAVGLVIPEEYFAAVAEGSTLTFYAMMHFMPFGFRKDWIKGSAYFCECQDSLAQEYGDHFKT